MKILTINLADSNGLSNIKMKKLDKIVLIAGKNGSGKSRLLKEIKKNLSKKLTINQKDTIEKNIIEINSSIKDLILAIDNISKDIENTNSNIKALETNTAVGDNSRLTLLKNNLKSNKLTLSKFQSSLDNKNKSLISNNILINNISSIIETDALYEKYEIIDFVPKDLNLENPEKLTKEQKNIIVNDSKRGFEISNNKAFTIIQTISDNWFRATHPTLTISNDFKNESIEAYKKLQRYINIFLDTDLGFLEDGSASLFNLKLGDSKLSNGQIILLQLCIEIYLQEGNLEESIIFMDEPENHLHPKALLDVINKLSETITKGQIWIATHSINLLSNFDPKYIWYMEKGNIQYAGKIPERVLESLIGDKDNISKLENFISLPSQMATNNFAYECLFEPLQLVTGKEDPQVGQIIEAIKTKHNGSDKVKILDFGAGKCRLLSTIDEIGKTKEIPTIDWLDYYAYDLPSDNKKQCLNILNDIYSNKKDRYFDNKSTFRDNMVEKSFDMIILSNVFHEIDPKYWNDEFGETSLINYALKEDGILLIIEDQLIPVGEKAYQNGFLVFDKEQFKKLFNIKDYYVKEEKEGRLKAHYIEKKYLKNITNESKKEAIKSLEIRAKDQITKIREGNPSFENGKLHAFWTQQLANSYLAYSQL